MVLVKKTAVQAIACSTDAHCKKATTLTRRKQAWFKQGAGIVFAIMLLFLVHGAIAQQSALNSQARVYIDYPQPSGRVEPFKLNNFPKWATLDMQIRERGENQSSDGYVSGNDAVYDLSRVWGGLELRPTQHFLAYIQFMDTHALGLPLHYVSANMRDDFDARQAFLEYHARNVKIIAGRQELI